MKSIKISLILFFIAIAQGCAFTTATLDVGYDEENAKLGPVSTVSPLGISINQFNDNREDKERIGWKKNGFGQNTADILSARPVTEIVYDAVKLAFEKNNHTIEENGIVLIEGNVNKFWFDSKVNFWTIEFIGTVDISLRFYEGNTGNLLYENNYNGYYNEESMGGLEKSWTRVMNSALDRLIESVVLDPELVAILENISVKNQKVSLNKH